MEIPPMPKGHPVYRVALRVIKNDCRILGIEVPRLTTYQSSLMGNYCYEIWTPEGSQGWFAAMDANDAKTRYLAWLIEQKRGIPQRN